MALSLLEVKDCPPSSPPGSEGPPPGERPTQSRSLDSKKQNGPREGDLARPELCSVPKQSAVGEINHKMVTGGLDPAEEPKQSKKKRQRRRATQRHVVGLPPCPSAVPPVLLWFRRDLRLCDNPALIGSLEVGAPIVPVFIWSPEEEEGPGPTVAMGGACE